MTFDLSEEQQQAVLLSIARLAVERPGWDKGLLRPIAIVLGGERLYDEFCDLKRAESVEVEVEVVSGHERPGT